MTITIRVITVKETIGVLKIMVTIEIGVRVLTDPGLVLQLLIIKEIIVMIVPDHPDQIVVVHVIDLIALIINHELQIMIMITPEIGLWMLITVKIIARIGLLIPSYRKTKYPCSRPALEQDGHSNADY
jgi:hypothetical protein